MLGRLCSNSMTRCDWSLLVSQLLWWSRSSSAGHPSTPRGWCLCWSPCWGGGTPTWPQCSITSSWSPVTLIITHSKVNTVVWKDFSTTSTASSTQFCTLSCLRDLEGNSLIYEEIFRAEMNLAAIVVPVEIASGEQFQAWAQHSTSLNSFH